MGINIIVEQTHKKHYVRYNEERRKGKTFPTRDVKSDDLQLTYDEAILQVYNIKRGFIENIKELYYSYFSNKLSWKKFKRSFFKDTKIYITQQEEV